MTHKILAVPKLTLDFKPSDVVDLVRDHLQFIGKIIHSLKDIIKIFPSHAQMIQEINENLSRYKAQKEKFEHVESSRNLHHFEELLQLSVSSYQLCGEVKVYFEGMISEYKDRIADRCITSILDRLLDNIQVKTYRLNTENEKKFEKELCGIHTTVRIGAE